MLSNEETLKLIAKSQEGDMDAKEKLVVENTPLVKSIVARYRGKSVEYEDLMQLGLMGLVKAINNFNMDMNVRLSTYAVPMITGEIKRFIRDDGAVKVSRALKTMNYKISGYVDQYFQEHGAQPSISEIAKEFGIDEEEVVYVMDSSKMPVSIYESNEEENGKCILDKLYEQPDEYDVIEKMVLKDCIKKLPDRERLLITLRYYKNKTQVEIAKVLGVSQVQVSRLESKIIDKLKKEIG